MFESFVAEVMTRVSPVGRAVTVTAVTFVGARVTAAVGGAGERLATRSVGALRTKPSRSTA